MAHDHSHGGHGHSHGVAKNIATAFGLNFVFAIVELVGGIATNSVSILSDALHDFGDSISLAVAWALQRRSGRGSDAHFSYGYRRFSLLGSVFLSGVLLVSSIFIVGEAIERLANPAEVHAKGMFWLAVVGILINGLAALRLKKGTTLNERAVWLHLVEDVLGWVAVLVASVVMIVVKAPWVRLLDPLLSLGITAWVLWNVWQNLRDTFRILLQGVPSGFDLGRLSADILTVDGVASLHDLHVWSQDGETHVMTVHAVLEPDAFGAVDAFGASQNTDIQRIKGAIRGIGRHYGADHVTVEIELPGEPDCEYLGKCE